LERPSRSSALRIAPGWITPGGDPGRVGSHWAAGRGGPSRWAPSGPHGSTRCFAPTFEKGRADSPSGDGGSSGSSGRSGNRGRHRSCDGNSNGIAGLDGLVFVLGPGHSGDEGTLAALTSYLPWPAIPLHSVKTSVAVLLAEYDRLKTPDWFVLN